jgi:putative Mn2+ efflux pump MntP
MPLIGWLVGRQILAYVAGVDHWVAFGLLLFVGAKMIWESRFQEKSEKVSDPLNVYVLFVLAVATSIDALAVGLSLCMVKVDIVTPVLIIGGVTFAVSFAGAYAGALAGHLFEIQLEIFGGIVLIGLGLKILVEHLLAA